MSTVTKKTTTTTQQKKQKKNKNTTKPSRKPRSSTVAPPGGGRGPGAAAPAPLQRRLPLPSLTGSAAAAASFYTQALTHPFSKAQPKLGMGCLTPSSVLSLYRNNLVPTFQATDTSFCVAVAMGRQTMAADNIKIWSNASAGATLNASTLMSWSWVNAGFINQISDSFRTISGAVRVNVRYAANALRGSVGGILIPHEAYQGFNALRYNDLFSLPRFNQFTSTSGGEVMGEVQYRPVDNDSFVFNANGYNNSIANATIDCWLIIVGTGWPAYSSGSWAIEVDFINNVETLSAVDAGASVDFDSGPTLADSGFDINTVTAVIKTIPPPVTTSATLIDAINRGMANVNRARRGMGPSLRHVGANSHANRFNYQHDDTTSGSATSILSGEQSYEKL